MDEHPIAEPSPPASDAHEPENFLLWAMGTRNRALAIALGPSLAGALIAAVTFALHFGERQMLGMRLIPWDILSEHQCFLIGWNFALFCLWVGPAVAAVVLLLRPKLRPDAPSGDAPTVIAWPYWVLTAVGTILILGLAPEFFFFWPGSHRACYELSFHYFGWVMLGLGITVVSPAATMATLTGAFVLWRRDRDKRLRNPNAAAAPTSLSKGDDPRRIMRQCGWAALIIGIAQLGYGIWIARASQTEIVINAVVPLAVGAFLFTGRLGVARVGAWCAAAWLVATVGAILIAPMRAPWPMVKAEWHAIPWAVTWTVVWSVAQVLVALWFYQRLRARPILEMRRGLNRSVAPPWTGFAAGFALVVMAAGSLHYMQSSHYGRAAKSVARFQYGDRYDYLVTNLEYASDRPEFGGSKIYAAITGYNDKEIIRFEVEVPH